VNRNACSRLVDGCAVKSLMQQKPTQSRLYKSLNINGGCGQATIALHDDEKETGVEIEEDFVDTLALPVDAYQGDAEHQGDFLCSSHGNSWLIIEVRLQDGSVRTCGIAVRRSLGKDRL
jgi:hypothetical protein